MLGIREQADEGLVFNQGGGGFAQDAVVVAGEGVRIQNLEIAQPGEVGLDFGAVRGIWITLQIENAGGMGGVEGALVMRRVVGDLDVALGLGIGCFFGKFARGKPVQRGEEGVDGLFIFIDAFIGDAGQVIGFGRMDAFGSAGDDLLEERNGVFGGGKARQEEELALFTFHEELGDLHLAVDDFVEFEAAGIVLDEKLIGVERLLGMMAAFQQPGVEQLGQGRLGRIGIEDPQGQGLLGGLAGFVGGLQFLDIFPLAGRILLLGTKEQMEAALGRGFHIGLGPAFLGGRGRRSRSFRQGGDRLRFRSGGNGCGLSGRGFFTGAPLGFQLGGLGGGFFGGGLLAGLFLFRLFLRGFFSPGLGNGRRGGRGGRRRDNRRCFHSGGGGLNFRGGIYLDWRGGGHFRRAGRGLPSGGLLAGALPGFQLGGLGGGFFGGGLFAGLFLFRLFLRGFLRPGFGGPFLQGLRGQFFDFAFPVPVGGGLALGRDGFLPGFQFGLLGGGLAGNRFFPGLLPGWFGGRHGGRSTVRGRWLYIVRRGLQGSGQQAAQQQGRPDPTSGSGCRGFQHGGNITQGGKGGQGSWKGLRADVRPDKVPLL